MPDIVVHNAAAERILKGLDREIASNIDREIFRFSVMGPDPYIYYRFFALPLRHGISRRADTMHAERTQQFLTELAKQSRSREMFSFLAGFLCHFALDSTSHPFICSCADDQDDLHAAIERRLDRMELERQGKQPRDIMRLFAPYPDLPGVREAMKNVYGWDDRYYRISYRHMKWFHWIAKDQHGLLEGILRKNAGKLSAVSYRTRRADQFDLSPFAPLEEEAVIFGAELITAAWRFCRHEINEDMFRETIGTRSYHGRPQDR